MHVDPFDLPPRDWVTLRQLLDAALELAPSAREAWVAQLDPRHQALKPRLRALLSHAESAAAEALLNTLPKLGPPAGGRRAEPAALSGTCVGPYRLLRPIGEGGMATVWLAERTDVLQLRRVALKLPHPAWRRADLAERMVREREILSTLEHPHIARLYDAGVADDGQPYLALEYVEGVPIDVFCRSRGLGVRQRLALFLQVAKAVAHAHAQLVVHRDLKPSNILVTAVGEVRLLDFGIARLLERGVAEESDHTRETGRALTPDYAAPELIQGRPTGTAADVYSLGVVLYELLAGVRPYRLDRQTRRGLEEALAQVAPRRPSELASERKLQRALRGDVDTIVMKAIRPLPADRYTTVGALAEDIERHLVGRPVAARPDAWSYRLARFVARKRGAVLSVALVGATLLAGVAVATWQARLAQAERRHADEVKNFITGVIRDADPAAGRGKPLEAVELLRHARSRLQQIDAARVALRVELLSVTGEALLNLGDTGSAESLLRDAVDEAARGLAPTQELALRARLLLAAALGEREASTEMRGQLAELLPRLRARADQQPELLVRGLQQVAKMEIGAGHGAAAVGAAREAFALARQRLGEADVLTVDASNMLAEAQQYDGAAPDRLLAAAERGMRFAERAHAANRGHPQLVRMRETYAMALADAGDDAQAVAQWRQALGDAVLAHGPSSVVEGLIRGNMVPSLRRLGLVREAVQSADVSEALLARHLRPEARTRAWHLSNRATARLAAREPDAAVADYTQALGLIEHTLGATHTDAIDLRLGRAMAQAYRGHFDAAQADIAAAAELTRQQRPESLHNLLYTRALVLRLQGRWADALVLQREAIAQTPQDGLRESYLMRRLPERGLGELELGRPKEALATLREAQALMEKLQLDAPPARAEVWLGVGRALLASGQPRDGLVMIQRADAWWQGFDPANRAAGEAAYWRARALAALGRRTEARAADARAAAVLAGSPLPGDVALLRIASRS
jgi:eukaryotic-like serine/threonine-protein kinase